MPDIRRLNAIAPPVAIIVLRRDAVPEVGGAAEDVALDDGDLGAETGGVGGGLWPAGPPPMMTKRMLTSPGYAPQWSCTC
jgi:hypothetical protein